MVALCDPHRSIGTIRSVRRSAALCRRSDPSQTEFLGCVRAHDASLCSRHGGRSLLRGTSQGRGSGRWHLSIAASVKSIYPQPLYPGRHGAPASDGCYEVKQPSQESASARFVWRMGHRFAPANWSLPMALYIVLAELLICPRGAIDFSALES